jgi:hypothetical protein
VAFFIAQGYDMGDIERRKYPRFNVAMALKNFDLNCASEISASTRDISSKGIGCVSDTGLSQGTQLDIWLYLPDGEAIHTEGVIVWVCCRNCRYQMGIELRQAQLNPIPIVLRAIKKGTRQYN